MRRRGHRVPPLYLRELPLSRGRRQKCSWQLFNGGAQAQLGQPMRFWIQWGHVKSAAPQLLERLQPVRSLPHAPGNLTGGGERPAAAAQPSLQEAGQRTTLPHTELPPKPQASRDQNKTKAEEGFERNRDKAQSRRTLPKTFTLIFPGSYWRCDPAKQGRKPGMWRREA